MTHQEAAAILKAKFPGKRFYVSCHIWTDEDGKTNSPRYAATVYDVRPKDPDEPGNENASGFGSCIRAAVEEAIKEGTAQRAPKEADAMFI